ncbi:hypothetical protein AAJP84_01585 [Bartonella schoenbuchensis]
MLSLSVSAFEEQQSPFLAFAWKGGFFAHSTISTLYVKQYDVGNTLK